MVGQRHLDSRLHQGRLRQTDLACLGVAFLLLLLQLLFLDLRELVVAVVDPEAGHGQGEDKIVRNSQFLTGVIFTSLKWTGHAAQSRYNT